MKRSDAAVYRCPQSGEKLRLEAEIADAASEEILSGRFMADSGNKYPIDDGIPDFSYPFELGSDDKKSRQEYNSASGEYDEMQKVTFSILRQDEDSFRRAMAEQLRLKKRSVVLETAAGTGLNIPYITEALAGEGNIHVQDISCPMLKQSRKYDNRSLRVNIHRSVGNAAYLPFADKYFDAVLSFGGIGVFSEQKRAIQEMVRVVKVGGRIVFGDEGVAPWLRESEYGMKLMSNNHLYSAQPPIGYLPVEAREVSVSWIMNGAFYLIALTVGEGEPEADFDYPIPGRRGGTINTRYNGRLKGASKGADKSGEES